MADEQSEAASLLTNFKPTNDGQIPLWINLLQIVQQAATTTYHTQESTPAGIVLVMRPHVFGEAIDSSGQNCNLTSGDPVSESARL